MNDDSFALEYSWMLWINCNWCSWGSHYAGVSWHDGGNLKAPPPPINPSIPYCCDVRGVLGRHSMAPHMMARHGRLSDSCTPDRCSFPNVARMRIYESGCQIKPKICIVITQVRLTWLYKQNSFWCQSNRKSIQLLSKFDFLIQEDWINFSICEVLKHEPLHREKLLTKKNQHV